jgi:ribosomal protein S1
LGGIDGLLHITDMAWRRVRHPSEVVVAGQEITAKILKFDTEKNRVSLGLKQMGDDPWMGVNRRYPQGTRMHGKVTNIADYGAFVELEPGIEGLVHVSEMDWTNKNVAPSKIVALGDEVEVMVLEIDEDKRRISLGMKQCKANPWQEFASATKRGILGGSVFVMFSSPMPTVYDPSFMKTFAPAAQLFTEIFSYREEPHFDWFENDWTCDPQIVSAGLCKRLDVTGANA